MLRRRRSLATVAATMINSWVCPQSEVALWFAVSSCQLRVQYNKVVVVIAPPHN